MSKNIITTTIIPFLLNYLKYNFLTGSVVFSLAVLLFTLLNLMPNFSFGFLTYFSFLDPAYKTGTFSMRIPEVMKIFSLVSLVIMFASYILRFTLEKIFNRTFEFFLKLKIFFFVAIITLAYVISAILITLNNALDSSFYFIFAVFYVFNIISLVLYFLIGAFIEKVNNLLETHKDVPENYVT